MQADIEIKPVSLEIFEPLLPAGSRMADLGLAQAEVAVSAIVKAVADKMTVTASISIPSYRFVAGAENNPAAISAKTVLDGLKGSSTVARYEYTFETKLSAPSFDAKAFQDDFWKNKSAAVGTGMALSLINSIQSSKAGGASSKEQAKTAAVTDGVKGLSDALFGKKEGKSGPDLQKGLDSILGAVSGVENAKQVNEATKAQPVEAAPTAVEPAAVTTPKEKKSDEEVAVQAAANLIGGLFGSSEKK
jgi:hypothetical protein